ncbi:MAG: hypothetical protein VW455_09480 [Nitrospinota bacterium]
MEQKTIAKVPLKVEGVDLTQEILEPGLFQPENRTTDLKSLDQAIHNIDLGIELLDKADDAYEKIEAHLVQIKELSGPGLASNLEPSKRSVLEEKISLKKKELDQLSESIKFKGKKILDGSLSASRNEEQHLYLMAGVTGSPENRVNLNTGLNIPRITSKTLGLGATFFNTPEDGFKTIMVIENALGICNRLKERSQALRSILEKIKRNLDVSVTNHRAAESAPSTLEKAEEFLRMIQPSKH